MGIIGDRPKFFIKQGALQPVLRGHISWKKNKASVSLEGATGTFRMMNSSGEQIISGEVVVETPETSGYFYYIWEEGDTDVAGKFDGEIHFADLANGPLTVPVEGYIEIIIVENLNGQLSP